MNRLFALLLVGALALAPSLALAADNTVLVTPCTSGCVGMKSKDIGAGVQSMQGLSYYGAAQLSSAVISGASSGNNTLVARSVGTIKVYGIFFACASTVVVTLRNGTSTGVTGAMTLTTFSLPISAEPYFTTTSTNDFVMNLGSAVQCSGTVYYLDN